MSLLQTTSVYVICPKGLLLIQRSMHDSTKPLFWEAPAGHVDVLCEARDSFVSRSEALRELQEETGIFATAQELQHLPRYSNARHIAYLIDFKDRVPSIQLSDEHCDYMWHNFFEKPPTNTRFEVRRFLRDIENV